MMTEAKAMPALARESAPPSPFPSTSLQDTASGVPWHAEVVTDDFHSAKLCLPSGAIKPRRPMNGIMIKVSDLIGGIYKVDGRYLYKPRLNGWPGLGDLELVSVTVEEGLDTKSIRPIWSKTDGVPPPSAEKFKKKGTRATFHAPLWSARGWTEDSRGFVYWFSKYKSASDPRVVLYGEKLLDELRTGPFASSSVAMVHAFAHRYPVESETFESRNTWHAGVMIEWSHCEFITIVELAWLNACGGYAGKANWIDDKLEPQTCLDKAMPDCMKVPWDTSKAEIRTYDMDCRSKEEFEAYLKKYSETSGLPLKEQRFHLPDLYASGSCRIRNCTPEMLGGQLLNYIHHVRKYELYTANCQTFAADLFAFLTAAKDIEPYGNIVKPHYKQRLAAFANYPQHA